MLKIGNVLFSACSKDCCCVQAEVLPDRQVKIHDPDAPERGEFILTAREWNLLLKLGVRVWDPEKPTK